MNRVPFIDIHTHFRKFNPENIVVRNVFPGDVFEDFEGCNYYSVGLHPWKIKTPEENDIMLNRIEIALESEHVCFVGECGLDKKVETDFKEQVRVFWLQAILAEKYKRPLLIHCVKAYNEIFELHKKMHPEMPWIMHGYNGNIQITEQLAKRGIFFSFGKSLFNENSKSLESLRYLPLEKIFLETDEFEGEIEQVYEKAASLKSISVEVLKTEVRNNFSRIESSFIERF